MALALCRRDPGPKAPRARCLRSCGRSRGRCCRRRQPHPAGIQPLHIAVAALEAQVIRDAMAATGGNKMAAARLLGIARATLYQKLAGIKSEESDAGDQATMRSNSA